MKLYEFTYTDNTNLSQDELSKRVDSFLQSECETQGWVPGFKVIQAKAPEKLTSGEINYFFEVSGEFLSSTNTDFESESSSNTPDSDSRVAAPFLNQ